MQSRGSTSQPNTFASNGVDVKRDGKLYEAYSHLHRVAQKSHVPLSSPIIVVVGHQTDGKSALIEALMGFQFNHVGNGTTTRRPVAIEMIYDKSALVPVCYLAEAGEFKEMLQEDLKAHIASENARLGCENRFESTDIIVRIEYKGCPNLTIVDTPGLIPAKKEHDTDKQVERIAEEKISQPEAIILCLEDKNDWVHASTRTLVQKVDPAMKRTVLVSTKFDTRLPQFATGDDAHAFLHPPKECFSGGPMLGGPFFTSVPSARVGSDSSDLKLETDEEFQVAVKEQQEQDQNQLESKMGRELTEAEASHLGVYKLRNFLEVVLQQRYRDHIPAITKILSQQTRKLEVGIRDVDAAQQMLSEDNIKFHVQRLVLRVHKHVHGLLTASVSLPERCGQTLLEEREQAGSLQCPPGFTLKADWEQSLLKRSGDQQLYAYAQYDRAMDEFRDFVGSLVYPEITKAEMNNQCGVGPYTDAPSTMTVAAKLAAEKANAFESLLPQLGERLKHVLERVMQLSRAVVSEQLQSTSLSVGSPALQGVDEAVLDCIQKHYSHFIEDCEAEARAAALLDLHSRTRFVTLEQDNGSASCDVVPCSLDIAHAVQSIRASAVTAPQILTNFVQKHVNPFVIQARGRTIESVPKLTERIFGGIRTGFTDDAKRKFNYKLLWPLQDGLLPYLQGCINQQDLETLWDIAEVKEELQKQHEQLTDDLQAVKDLKKQFNGIEKLICTRPGPASLSL